MSRSRKVLIFGGLILAALGMVYGLHYAIFVEHQSLDGMGMSLASGFVHASERRMPEAHAAIDTYGRTKYDYVRQVDIHSHWGGLAMIMIVLGVVFDSVKVSERYRIWIAYTMLVGSVSFPLGVILQTVHHGGAVPSAMAIMGSGLVIIALAAVAFGFASRGSVH
jgi:hypothetical protein